MNQKVKPQDIDVVILCGGKGKRLRAIVNDRPKSMSEFGGRPFLSILMEYIAGFGFRRFILCAGYLGSMIERYYSAGHEPWDIVVCREKRALDTGGAVKNAGPFIRSDPFLVLNGDSYMAVNFGGLLDFHVKKKALLSMVLLKCRKNSDSGKVVLDKARRLVDFREKAGCVADSFDSAGAYMMDRRIFSLMKSGKFSLEYDLFPKITGQRCFGYLQNSKFVDFGTAEGYGKIRKVLSNGAF